ncbi:MAG: glycosyltransferase, partial [Clostridiaceae bacterium]|nr:glycosyltransferase [Clostridiaceae bacterium]
MEPRITLNILIPFYNEEKQVPLTFAEVVRVMEPTGESFAIIA